LPPRSRRCRRASCSASIGANDRTASGASCARQAARDNRLFISVW
jgi:hypothetical protein